MDINSISTAIAEICQEFFIKRLIDFDVIFYGEFSFHVISIVNCLFDKIQGDTTVAVKHIRDTDHWHHMLDKSAIVFCSRESEFFKFIKNTKLGNIFQKDLTFLTYFDDAKDALTKYFQNSKSKFDDDETNVTCHEYFIGNNVAQVLLLKVVYFSPLRCNRQYAYYVNAYTKQLNRWIIPLRYEQKFSNFFGCSLDVVQNWGPLLYIKAENKEIMECFFKNYENCSTVASILAGTKGVQGFSVDIFKMVAEVANFTSSFELVTKSYDLPLTKSKIEASIYIGMYDNIYGGYSPTSFNIEATHMLAATPTEFYSNFEKLWLPFDQETWFLLLFTFSAAFTVIFCVQFMRQIIKILIFGQEATHPALNVIKIFFGISQIKLPKASVPRFILMLFIGFCLIFRTCYQSKSFEFMTSDVRKPPPSTVQDLAERNYTIVIYGKGHDWIINRTLSLSNYKVNIINNHEIIKGLKFYCKNHDKSEQKLAFFFENIQYAILNSICKGAAIKLNKFKFQAYLSVLFTKKNSFFYDLLNRIMEKIVPAGIPQYLLNYHERNFYGIFHPFVTNIPRVLTLKDLDSILVSSSLIIHSTEIDALAISIAELCQEFFIKRFIEFDIILYGKSTTHVIDIADCLLNKIEGVTTVTIEYVKDSNKWHHCLNKSAVIFCSNGFDFLNFVTSTRLCNIFPKEMTFFTYFSDAVAALNEYLKNTLTDYSNDITNVTCHEYFIGNSPTEVQLLKIDYFTAQVCNEEWAFYANRFYKSTKTWVNPLTYQKRFTNFYGCYLDVAEKWGPFLYLKDKNREVMECFINNDEMCLTKLTFLAASTDLQGVTLEIFNMMAKIANFTPRYELLLNLTESNIFTKRIKVEIFVASYENVFDGYSPTSLNFETNFLLAASPTEYYSNYEKLWLPFDRPTWILFFITFISSFLVIFGLRFAPQFIQNAIYGEEVVSPSVNVMQVFFGISQMKLPVASLPRFILMLFIGFCLIFRTCYQSKSFEFMTSDMRKPPPETYQELVERNYTVVTCAYGHEKVVKEMLSYDDERIIMLIHEYCIDHVQVYCNNYDKTDSKMAFFLENIQFIHFKAICKGAAARLKSFNRNAKLTALQTFKNSFLYGTLNELMEKLIPVGIPQYLVNYHETNIFGIFASSIVKRPRVLTVRDLEYGFVLWFGACVVSTAGFIVEIIWYYSKNGINFVTGLFVVLWTLRVRMRDGGM